MRARDRFQRGEDMHEGETEFKRAAGKCEVLSVKGFNIRTIYLKRRKIKVKIEDCLARKER